MSAVYNIQSFLALQEAGQQQPSNDSVGYNAERHFSPTEGMDVYLRAVDRISERIDEFEKTLSFVVANKNSTFTKQQDELRVQLVNLAEQYTATRRIFEEFLKGFSVTHDTNAKDIMSLLYRGFDYCMESLDIAYVTQKTSYLEDLRVKLGKIRELFEKSMTVLNKAEEPTPTSQTGDNSVSTTLDEISV